jgi:hypothetical protein
MVAKLSFKGNKQSLPSKPCAVCGRDMVWRKAWRNTWESVLYCSENCRQKKSTPLNSVAFSAIK